MAWINVGLEVMGEQQLARQFDLADEWSRDLSEPLGELMDALLDSVRAQFDTEGLAADGIPWQPLSDEYGTWKAEHFPGAPLLVGDGAMRAAMLNKLTAVHVSPDAAIYEPFSDIAGYHQKGPRDWIGPAWGHGEYHHHLPERQMVDLSDAWKHEHVDRTFAAWIAKKLAEGRAVGVPLAA